MIVFPLYPRWHLQFIRSEFRGQLPKPYSEGSNATRIIPTHMNDMNKEETTRYVSTVHTKFILWSQTDPTFEKKKRIS